MKVSVAIALYNTEAYIEECIESVLAQSYKNLEILIVNDGSTDASLEKCEKYKQDPRVRIIDKPNGGLSSARQAGLEAATGTYVCFIDADDCLAPDYVEAMRERLEREGADICMCATRFFSETSQQVCATSGSGEKETVTPEQLPEKYAYFCNKYMMSDSWNKLYRRDFLVRSGVRFEMPPKHNGTDSAYNKKLMLHCPSFVGCSQVLYHHRIVEGSAVHRKGRKLLNSMDLIARQVMEETRRLGLAHMDGQVYSLYLSSLRGALTDAYVESEQKGVKSPAFDAVYEKYDQMLRDYPSLKEAPFLPGSKASYVFYKVFFNRFLLWLYILAYSRKK